MHTRRLATVVGAPRPVVVPLTGPAEQEREPILRPRIQPVILTVQGESESGERLLEHRQRFISLKFREHVVCGIGALRDSARLDFAPFPSVASIERIYSGLPKHTTFVFVDFPSTQICTWLNGQRTPCIYAVCINRHKLISTTSGKSVHGRATRASDITCPFQLMEPRSLPCALIPSCSLGQLPVHRIDDEFERELGRVTGPFENHPFMEIIFDPSKRPIIRIVFIKHPPF